MLPLPTKVQNATLPPKKTQIFNWQKSPVSVNRTQDPLILCSLAYHFVTLKIILGMMNKRFLPGENALTTSHFHDEHFFIMAQRN